MIKRAEAPSGSCLLNGNFENRFSLSVASVIFTPPANV